ncbi:MAG TPA: hypothetical protein VMZ22_11450, partial [Acidimicrobiales bacterium]|nr:hypothetical protein [Acidimicrobiales bacterium]
RGPTLMVRRVLVVLALMVCASCGANPSATSSPAEEKRARLGAYLGGDGFDYELVLQLSDVQITQKSVGVFEAPDRLEYTLDTGDRIRVLGNRVYEFEEPTGWAFSRTVGDTDNFRGLLSPFLDADWTSVGEDAHSKTEDGTLVAAIDGSQLKVELEIGEHTHYSIRFSNLDGGQRVST